MRRLSKPEQFLANLITLLIVVIYLSISCTPKAKFGGQRFGEPPLQKGQVSDDDRHQED